MSLILLSPNSTNYFPKLRFPGFSDEWKRKKLEEVGEVINGLTYNPSNIDESGILVLRSSNVQNRSITLTDNVYVKTNNYNAVKENDILICVRNGSKNLIGKNAIIEKHHEGLAFGAFMTIYRSDFNKFLFQWFDTKEYKDIINKNLGATINSINGGDLKKFKVPFPSIEEQNKISAFLSSLDSRIQLSMKTIKQLESQIQIFIDDIMEEKLKLNGTHENWKTFEMSEIGETFNGLTGKGKENFGSGKRYIQYKQIFDSKTIKINDCGFVEISKNENQNKVKFGDAFFTISSETPNEIGMSSVLLENVEDVYLNSFSFGFRTFSHSILNPRFASFLFRSKIFRNSIVKLAQGSTRYNMSKNEFLKLKIKLPSESEQVKIFQILERISEKLETENRILTLLEQQKKYFLQNLFI